MTGAIWKDPAWSPPFVHVLRDPERCEVGETEVVRAGKSVVTVLDGKRRLQVLNPGDVAMFVVEQIDTTEDSFRYWTWPTRNLSKEAHDTCL